MDAALAAAIGTGFGVIITSAANIVTTVVAAHREDERADKARTEAATIREETRAHELTQRLFDHRRRAFEGFAGAVRSALDDPEVGNVADVKHAYAILAFYASQDCAGDASLVVDDIESALAAGDAAMQTAKRNIEIGMESWAERARQDLSG